MNTAKNFEQAYLVQCPMPDLLIFTAKIYVESRFIGLFNNAGIPVWTDGKTSDSFNSLCWERLTEHPVIQNAVAQVKALESLNFGGHNEKATHLLMLDTTEKQMFVFPRKTGIQLLKQQHPHSTSTSSTPLSTEAKDKILMQRQVNELARCLDHSLETSENSPQPLKSSRPRNSTQTVCNNSAENTRLEAYNQDPGQFFKLSRGKKLSETQESIEKRISGRISAPILRESRSGEYFVVPVLNSSEAELFPKNNQWGKYTLKSAEALFQVSGTQSLTSSTFILKKPAKVRQTPEQKWELVALGLIEFN
ncbi:hypothetical protein ACQ4M3_13055 [Leptolyngbya sp. AN03gr2]|uniref:hypothetical protein n=1 Tax=unclassified Leptolyngbya TaxID=2650499 RepID=UPI003D313739